MIRQAFLLKLKPGAFDEYKRYHDEIWPELVDAIRASGIRQITTFHDDPYLILYSEVEDEGAWDRLWETDTHTRWGDVMSPLLEFGPDGKVSARFLPGIFNLDT